MRTPSNKLAGLTLIVLMDLAGLLACVAPESGDASVGATSDTVTTTGTTTDATDTTSADTTSADTESTESTESETGPMCTGETCSSTLTLTFAHSLPLLDGPHRIFIETPANEILCSVEASPDGDKSCFGFAFADLTWTPDLVTVLLTNPFFDAVENPEAVPFESVAVRVERGEEVLYEAEVPIDSGEATQPDPCGPECWQAVGTTTIE